MAASKDFIIEQGKTWSQVIRWEEQPIVYKAITAITRTAPVEITCPSHNIPSGWRVAVVSVKGMTQINAENPPKDRDYHPATVIDADTVELNDVNASDFKAYISGGYLQYNTPVDLAGFTARMKIRDRVGGTLLASTEVSDAPLDIITASINNTDKTISIVISASATAALTWTKGVYDIELVSPAATPVVTALLAGAIAITKEVTTS